MKWYGKGCKKERLTSKSSIYLPFALYFIFHQINRNSWGCSCIRRRPLENESLKNLLLIAIALFVGIGSMVGSSAAGHTPCQEGSIESLKIGFKMGQMYALAQQGHNISGFNAEVDKYNEWIQQNFGNDQNLMMSKMPMPGYGNAPPISGKPIHAMDANFNTTPSDLRPWLSNVLALTAKCLSVQFLLPKFASWLRLTPGRELERGRVTIRSSAYPLPKAFKISHRGSF